MLYFAGPGPYFSPVIAMSGMNSFSYNLNLPLNIVSLLAFSKVPMSLKVCWLDNGLLSWVRTLAGSWGVTYDDGPGVL